jgi:hypothetical protein
MEKSSQVTKVEGYVYRKFIRDYGVKKKKNICKLYLCVNTNNKLKIIVRIVRNQRS